MKALSSSNAVVGAIVVACVAVPLLVYQRAQTRLRNSEELARQSSRASELTAENQQLSNRVAHASGMALSNEELGELLRLRAEMGRLRQATGEVSRLRTANERLLAYYKVQEKQAAAIPPPEPQTILAHWSKDQLAFAGYSDPASALKTMLWAIVARGSQSVAASVTTNALKRLTREQWNVHESPDVEIAAATKKIADSLNLSTAFSVIGQKLTSTNQATLEVYFAGEGKTRKVAIVKSGNEWKFNDLADGVWP
jgi:hypothetical protein